MKIILVHNKYQQPGGEDIVFEQEKRLLERNGHDVLTYCRTNDEIDGFSPVQRILLASKLIWAADSRADFERILGRFQPDLVHVHNTFMLISPSIYSACRERAVPVVQTLHNFRLLCPAGAFFRDGKPCEECSHHSLWRGVAHGCYRGSRLATAAVAGMLATHRALGTWTNAVSRYIVLNDFSRSKFVRGGFAAEKLCVKPNFVDPDPGIGSGPREGAVFLGRRCIEKGIRTLLDAWQTVGLRCTLELIGSLSVTGNRDLDGHADSPISVAVHGHLPRAEAIAAIKRSAFLILPSLWFEGFPMCIVEAFACGTPVICSRLGGMRELVDDGRTGIHFNPGDARDLAGKVIWAIEHPAEMAQMGQAARLEYEQKFTAAVNYERLIQIYRQTLFEANGSEANGAPTQRAFETHTA